jgi:hypothetical protein
MNDELGIEDILDGFSSSEAREISLAEDESPEGLKETTVAKIGGKLGEEVAPVVSRLEGWNKSCRDILIDLRSVRFGADDEDMYIDFVEKQVYGKRIYFKRNPEDPKDPRILHAQKQFCKILGVPHKYFMDSRPTMKKQMFKLHQSTFNADNGEKAQYMARIRESQDHSVLRALIPLKHSLINNSELMKIVEETAQPEFLDFVNGDERDDLVLHARCIFKEEYKLFGQPVRIGFSLVGSELGASPLTVDVLIYDCASKTSYVASYGGDSFFESNYSGIQPSDIKELFPALLQRVKDELPEMLGNIQDSQKEVYPEDEATKVSGWKRISPKFKKALFHEACECSDDMGTTWDFARHMSLIAKDFDWKKRLDIEKAAGRYLNLYFAKN